MEVKDGKITKCSDSELYGYWLKRYSYFMSYPDFKAACIEAGTVVEEDDEE